MNGHKPFPCPEWAKWLTVLHEEDFSYTDLVALNEHLASCSACSSIREEYLTLANALGQAVSSYDPPTEIPPKLRSCLQRTSTQRDVSVENRKQESSWRRIRDSFIDASELEETVYHQVQFSLSPRKSLEDNRQYPSS